MTHAKAILFGEHSVVYDKYGISIPLKEMNISINFENKKIDEQIMDENLKYLYKICNMEKKNIIINSNIPIGKGLGSSAAFAVEFAKAAGIDDIKNIGTLSEEYIHGKSSGIDLAQVMSDIPLFFNKKEGIRELSFNLNAYLLIIDTGEKGSTKEAVDLVRRNYDINKKYIDKLGEIALLAKENIDDVIKIGELMIEAHFYLDKIGVANNDNNFFVEDALKNNAIGAKLTGGGFGGCNICLFKNKYDALNYKNKITKPSYLVTI